MGKFCSILGLVLVAVIFTAVAGISILRNRRSSPTALSSPPLLTFLRSARDVHDNSAEMAKGNNETGSFDDPCQNYLHCSMDIEKMSHYGFEGSVEILEDLCTNNGEGSCDLFTCNNFPSDSRHATYLNGTLAWACAHRSQFEDGSGCWGAELKRRMRVCFRQRVYALHSTKVEEAIECVANVTRLEQGCSEQDTQLVQSFFDYMLGLARELYPGQ